MRIKKGFVLRRIGDETVVVGEGLEQVNFNKVICLNESATYIWNECVGKEFDLGMLADLMVAQYAIDRSIAIADARELTDNWAASGMLEK